MKSPNTRKNRRQEIYTTFEEYQQKMYPRPMKEELEEEEESRGFNKKLSEESKKKMDKILSEN